MSKIKVSSKSTILCWATFTGILGHMRLAGCGWTALLFDLTCKNNPGSGHFPRGGSLMKNNENACHHRLILRGYLFSLDSSLSWLLLSAKSHEENISKVLCYEEYAFCSHADLVWVLASLFTGTMTIANLLPGASVYSSVKMRTIVNPLQCFLRLNK